MAESLEDMLNRLDNQTRSLGNQLVGLRHSLHRKADRDDVERATRSATDQIENVERGLTRLAVEIDDTDARLRASMDERDRTHRSDAERIVARVNELERYVRMAQGVPVADLDHDADLVALARVADHGAALREDLLDDDDRTRREAELTAWTTWRDEYRAAVDGALTAALALAGTEPHTPDRDRALATMQEHHATVRRLRETRDATRTAATRAAEAIALDAATRDAHAAELAAGEAAETSLRDRLGARLDRALERDQLMPVWLHDRLGPHPQEDDTRWRELATDVLVHRATHDVQDARRALGEPPVPDDRSRAARLHRTLTWRLDRT